MLRSYGLESEYVLVLMSRSAVCMAVGAVMLADLITASTPELQVGKGEQLYGTMRQRGCVTGGQDDDRAYVKLSSH